MIPAVQGVGALQTTKQGVLRGKGISGHLTVGHLFLVRGWGLGGGLGGGARLGGVASVNKDGITAIFFFYTSLNMKCSSTVSKPKSYKKFEINTCLFDNPITLAEVFNIHVHVLSKLDQCSFLDYVLSVNAGTFK